QDFFFLNQLYYTFPLNQIPFHFLCLSRAERQRYGVPLDRGASRSQGQRANWPLSANANRCIFRSVLDEFFRLDLKTGLKTPRFLKK
ncbi:MAG: hypothetical protein R3243_15785, partial [Arenibacter latericius]|nr:hypothetical protein [Arenibacter latericius]